MKLTMEERLRDGYIFYCSSNGGNVKGSYIKKTDSGLCYLEPCGDENILINSFSNISKDLNSGNILQIYMGDACYMFTVMIGRPVGDGPYGENECLSDVVVTYGDSPIVALNEINRLLGENNKKCLQLKKAHRLYGQDKYQF